MNSQHNYKKFVERNGYKVINCLKCGYWHVWPMPKESELNEYYEKKYFENIENNPSMTDKVDDKDGFYNMQYDDRLKYIDKFIPESSPRSIFDVGAGYGDFLRRARSKGWQVQGLEPSKHALSDVKCDDLNIQFCSINDLSKINFNKVSVVTLNNVLEHLNNPEEVLGLIRDKLLLKDGIISINVPNDFNTFQDILMQTVHKDIKGSQHYWVLPPEHLNYWSSTSIKIFLEKIGFNVLYAISGFPMELFPLMGEDYVTHPEIGRNAHLKRVKFEKCLNESHLFDFKASLFQFFNELGIGRDMQIIVMPKKDRK